MKEELLKKFQSITRTEEKQLEHHSFCKKISDKTLVNNAVTKELIVFADNFFENRPLYIAKHSRFAMYPLHTHTFYVLNYVISGEITEIVNGHPISLTKGDILLLNIGTAHQVLAAADNDIMINLSFHADELSVFSELTNIPFLLFPKATTDKKIRQILEVIIDEYFYVNAESKENIIDLIKVLNRMLSHNSNAEDIHKNRKSETLSQKVLFEINQNYEKISLKDVASRLNYNPSYLGQTFKKNLGLSFHEVLLNKRLTEAYHQLLLTSLPVNVISRKVGFTRKSTFYDAFKNKYHRTPKQIRTEQKMVTDTKFDK